MWQFPPFRLDVTEQILYRDDARIPLMAKPFAVLQYLVEHAGRLVTQDELLEAVWAETHVQPEVLRRSILEIRRVLGDRPEAPRYVETVTKRGYRFIASVTAVEADRPVDRKNVPVRKHGRRTVFTMATILAIGVPLLLGRFLWNRWHSPRLTSKDIIVLADFANSTGDPIFDGTLRLGLAVQLEQSPFLSVVSEEQIQQALRLMGRPAATKLTLEVVKEACVRTGSTIVLQGEIAQIGRQYSLILKAINCSNGESVASTEGQAGNKSDVLGALGKAASEMRKKLGESLATIQKFDTPLEQASTPSLDALQAYSLGFNAQTRNADFAAALPLYKRAITLDPHFALAYLMLGEDLRNLGENTLAADNVRKAYDLRSGVSEREKRRIEAEYSFLATDNLEAGQRALEVWTETYPREWLPRNQLGVLFALTGQHEKTLTQLREALRLYPGSRLIYGNLVRALIAMDRLDEARAIADEAIAKHLDSPVMQVTLYRLAFLRNDREAMERQMTLGRDQPGLENELLSNEAATSAYFGRIEKARSLSEQAIALAERTDQKEAAAGYEADAALQEAMFGYAEEARRRAESALRLSNGSNVQYRAALALALSGASTRPLAIAEDMSRRFPENTTVRFVRLPTLYGQLALTRNDAAKTIEVLEAALPYELGGTLHPAYVRGSAYLAERRGRDAEGEFQKILDHRGIVLNSPIGALVRLQLGRALVVQGDVMKARAAYQDFLTLWKDADAGIPILRQARLELANLNRY
jgi:DNA-binding winged helix-turn-helix (wHTH) protein/Flp pilus assembly protein TadD